MAFLGDRSTAHTNIAMINCESHVLVLIVQSF